jgi:hypothetical protein
LIVAIFANSANAILSLFVLVKLRQRFVGQAFFTKLQNVPPDMPPVVPVPTVNTLVDEL